MLAAGPATAQQLPSLPNVLDGRVESFAVVGDRAFVAGTFTQVKLQDGSTVSQPYLFAYALSTGAFDASFRPQISGGQVLGVEAVPGGSGVYVAGAFTSINGTTRRRLARLRLDGSLDTSFAPAVNARVKDVVPVGSRLFIGGSFTTVSGVARTYLAEISPDTGALVPAFNFSISGNASSGEVLVQSLRASPDGQHLAVVHNGTAVGGASRVGVAILDLSGSSTTLNPWWTNQWSDNIARVGGIVRANSVAWDPTSSWIVVASNAGDRPPTNDTVSKFVISGTGPRPAAWVARQFDSNFSVAVGADGTVYAGGHFRYSEAPGSMEPWPGEDTVNYGFGPAGGARVLGTQVVGRMHLTALNPQTGKAANWYQTADGRFGVTALKALSDRLLVGHDGQRVAGLPYGKHGAVPLFGATRDQSLPLSTIADPIMGKLVPVGNVTLSGTASAPAGLSSVTVEIKKEGEWLQANGTWSTTFYQWPADVDLEAGGTSGSWSLTVPLPLAGYHTAISKARDSNGVNEQNRITVPFETVDPSNTPPTMVVTSPTFGQSSFPTNRLLVSGTATDVDGVAGVQLSFYSDNDKGYLQPDGSTSDEFNSFSAVLGASTGSTTPWSAYLRMPSGSWTMLATPVDVKGVAAARGWAVPFVMSPGNTAPAVSIASPTSGAKVTGTVTITGTASDNAGVKSVLVRMADQRFTLGPLANGAFGSAPPYLAATLASPGARSTTWSITFPNIPVGVYTIQAYAEDAVSVQTPTASQPVVTNVQQRPAAALASEPTTTLAPSGDLVRFATLSASLSGTAAYGGGVASVRLAIRDPEAGLWLQNNGSFASTIAYRTVAVASPNAASTTFATSLAFPREGRFIVDAIAVGRDGNVDWTYAGARQTYYVFPGDADPTLEWNTPTAGATMARQIGFTGRAFDDKGVQSVQMLLTNSATTGLRSDGTVGTSPAWQNAYVTNPGGLWTNFTYNSPVLPAGTWTLTVRVFDSVGKPMITLPTRVVTVTN